VAPEELARELRAVLERVLLPGLAAVLPWSWCTRLYGLLARAGFLYRGEIDAAWEHARHYLPTDPLWKRRARFHLLVDNADYFLTLFRGRRWMARHIAVTGGENLPAGVNAMLLVTFHWGQGFWALRWLRERGQPAAWLHAPVASRLRPGGYVSGLMGRLRIRQVARLSGARPIPVGGSISAMRERLQHARLPVMAMPDAPLRPGQRTLAIELLGRPARIAAGVITMAAEDRVPVHAYTMRVDPLTGQRHLAIGPRLPDGDPAVLAQALADVLSGAIREDPAAWYVWAFAGGFFPSAAGMEEQDGANDG
jgi:hypothetical protein